MKRIVIVLCIFFMANSLLGQTIVFKKEVYIKLCDIYIYSINKIDSSVNTYFGDDQSNFFKAFDYNSQTGKFKFSFFDTTKKIFIKGSYLIDKKHTYKRASVGISARQKPQRKVIYTSYQKAVKFGNWIYTNENGDILKP